MRDSEPIFPAICSRPAAEAELEVEWLRESMPAICNAGMPQTKAKTTNTAYW